MLGAFETVTPIPSLIALYLYTTISLAPSSCSSHGTSARLRQPHDQADKV